ncbi:unnamed protein product, partial [Meganyctiphanes norvegica]
MHLFVRTLYMLTVMIMTAMMMLFVLLCTPDLHTRLAERPQYQQREPNYGRMVVHSLDNPGIYVAKGPQHDDKAEVAGPIHSVKREVSWDYNGNNTGYLKVIWDYGRPQHDPWVGSPGCAGLKVSFARRRTLPRTALASFPGSGNTWLRFLIQSVSGIFTGSVYNDRQLAAKGFYGENEMPECGCTSIVKTHGYCLVGLPQTRWQRVRDVEKFFGRGLLLVRNPYDAIIAYRNYLAAGHLGVASRSAYSGTEWHRFVRGQIEIWRSYALDWIQMGRSSMIVHYEHLIEDTHREMLRIMKFLRLRVDEQRLDCTLKHNDGSFKRNTPNHIFYRLHDPFTPELHGIVEAAIDDVNDALEIRKWPQLPKHLYNYHEVSNTT